MTFWICDVIAKAVTQTRTRPFCPNISIMSPALVREREDGLREGWREGNRQRQRDTERDHGLVPNRCETPAGITLN